jgi:quercetin dioxygenase-like cupin family protein
MRPSQGITGAMCGLLIYFAGPQSLSGQAIQPDPEGFVVAQPEHLRPPEGERRVTILGDPSEPGPYVIRVTFLPGQGSRPHYHDQARYITVIEGTWWVARGARADVYDPDRMERLEAGSFIYQPPNGHHYDMAKDEPVTVQIMGVGPVRTTRLEP